MLPYNLLLLAKKGIIEFTNNSGDGLGEEAGNRISFEIPISFNSPDYYGEIHHEGLVKEGEMTLLFITKMVW